MPEGVLLLDAEGVTLLANPTTERHLAILAGASPGERLTRLGNRPLAEFLTSPPQGLWHEVSAGEHIFEVVARQIVDEPRTALWVSVIRDATQARQVRRRHEQQERLAAGGQLPAGMAHDFNNILAVIVLYAHMAEMSVDASHPVRRWMRIINDQSGQATNLVQQMLDFSRQSDMQFQSLDLFALLELQAQLLSRTLPEHIRLTLDAASDSDYSVHADATRIQQIVTNLAINSRDAMAEGGTLRISLAPLMFEPGDAPPLPAMGSGKWIRMMVADSGTGMAPEVRQRLFEPFFTTKVPGRGTGLGLAQAYGIVSQHRGHIDVESALGQGTIFMIYLPAASERPTADAEGDVVEDPRGLGETVLVVEDNASLREALGSVLTDLGYMVVEADDGETALTLVEGQGMQVDLIVSDVVMPRMGGIALLLVLRERGLQMPVILLIGHSFERQRTDLWGKGLSAWLRKPPLPAELAHAVARALHVGD